ncbi:hypothetical protein BH20ACT2_BH20ACT2_15700 [soil metagenome]
MNVVAAVLLLGGYAGAVSVLVRWIPVVLQRRTRWFVIHQIAVAAIVLGWIIQGRTSAIVVNGAWFIVAAAWYTLAAHRDMTPQP